MSDCDWYKEATSQRERAEKAEARVEELERRLDATAELADSETSRRCGVETRALKAEARVAELEAEVADWRRAAEFRGQSMTMCAVPNGHVAVMLPTRCVVDWLEREVGPDLFHKACRKALEGEDE